MGNPRLNQISLVIYAASLALSGCGIALMSGYAQSTTPQAATPLDPLAPGTQTKAADSKHT
jgi:hypothetical protein